MSDDSSKNNSKKPDVSDSAERQRRIEAERKLQEEKAAELLRQQKITKDDEALKLENERKQNTSGQILSPMEVVDNSKATSNSVSSEPRPSMSHESIDKAVSDVHAAVFATTMGVSSPDSNKLIAIFSTANKADRETIEVNYEKQYPGSTLRQTLKENLGETSTDYARMIALLNRKDGKADEEGQIQVALARLNNAKGECVIEKTFSFLGETAAKSTQDFIKNPVEAERNSAENDIMKTLASMDSSNIEKLLQTQDPITNKDMKSAILDNPNISPEAKQAISLLFNGNNRSGKDTLALARIGTDFKRPDIFNIAMQNASKEAREQFKNEDGAKRMLEAFEGFDLKAAQDYLEFGSVSFTNLVEGNTHWYHTNQDAISTSVKNATEEERVLYARGKNLSAEKSDAANLSVEDKRALDFYTKAHKTLMDAGNSDREVVLWESQLLKRTSVEQDMLKTHSDGYFTTFNWNVGSGHKRDDFFKAIESISKEDWQRIKDNRDEELKQIDKSLETIASEDERAEATKMLTEKVNADSYEDSKLVGRRGVERIIADGGDILEAIATMTPNEREHYKSNVEFRDQLNAAKDRLSSIQKRDVVQYLLNNPDTSEPVKQVLIASTKSSLEDPLQTVRNMEEAFKADPNLLVKIKNTEEALKQDKKLDKIIGRSDEVILTRAFQTAVDAVARTVDPAQNMVTIRDGEPGVLPHVRPVGFEEFQKSLWETGRMDLERRLQLAKFSKDPLDKYRDLASATEQERQKAYKIVQSPANNFLQVTEDEKQLVELGVKQNGFTKADEYLATIVSPTRTEEQRKVDFEKMIGDFEKMTPAQKQDMANEYFTKTGKLFSIAVLEKAPEEDRWRLRGLLSPTDSNVRQVVLDARSERSKHNSVLDNFMDNHWDATRRGAESASDNLNKFIIDNKETIDALEPEARKKFDDAVANYKKAEKEYIDSKGKLAETFVDATITIAAVGGAVFTGGTSLTLLQAIGVGAAGAAYRTTAMKVIQGSDFDSSAQNIARQSFKGSTAAILGFIGPEQLAMKGFVRMGDEAATRVAEKTLLSVTEVGIEKTAFKEGIDVANTISSRVSDLKKQMVIMGTKDSEKAIQNIVDEVMTTSATQGEKEIFKTALASQMKEQAVKSIREKLISEADSAALNVITGSGANVITEVLATVVGLDNPNTLFERMASGAVSGAGGALVFHGAFRAVRGGVETIQQFKVGKDQSGLFAGENTIVRLANGEILPVGEGQKYYFQQGDTLVVPSESTDLVFTISASKTVNETRPTNKTTETTEATKTSSPKDTDSEIVLPASIDNSKTGGRTEVQDGLVSRMVTPDGKEYSYKYTNGELSEIEMPALNNPQQRLKLRKNGNDWEYYEANPNQYYKLDNQYSVDKNGSLITKTDKEIIVNEGDGTVSTYNNNGRLLSVKGAEIEQQSERLLSLIETKLGSDPKMQTRMRDWMEQLRGREVKQRQQYSKLTDEEIALTFKEVSRLLDSDEPGALLSKNLRPKLAEQILFHAAHPELIEQGPYPTCNTATVQNRTFTRQPSDMAKLIVDVALTGKYSSKFGNVDMRHLKLDSSSDVFNLTQKFGPENTSGMRSMASQIAQETMINIHWQLKIVAPDGKSVTPGTLVYKKVYPANLQTDDSGMRLVNKDTKEIYLKSAGSTDGPRMSVEDIKLTQNLVGKDDSNDNFWNRFTWSYDDIVEVPFAEINLNSPENLKKALLHAQKNGVLPIIIQVNHTHKVIGGPNSQFRDLVEGEAAHVVTIRSIDENGRVELVNQWRRDSDRLLDKSATVEEVFDSMKLQPSKQTNPLPVNPLTQMTQRTYLDIPALSYSYQ